MKKVLILGDRNIIFKSIGEICSEHNWQIEFIQNGEQGLGKLICEKFDLIVSPLFLEKVDAIKILSTLKREDSLNEKTPYVLITSDQNAHKNFQDHIKPDAILFKNAQTLADFKQFLTSLNKDHSTLKSTKVLYIDDDKTARKMVELWLSKFPQIELDLCSSLAELKTIKHFDYDLIASDHFLVDGNSNDVVAYLAQCGVGDLPIYIYTATISSVNIEQLQKLANVKKVLKKPFEIKSFLALL